MLVTARRSVEFPKLQWAISSGDTKALPEDRKAQALILQHPAIVPIKTDTKKVASPGTGVK